MHDHTSSRAGASPLGSGSAESTRARAHAREVALAPATVGSSGEARSHGGTELLGGLAVRDSQPARTTSESLSAPGFAMRPHALDACVSAAYIEPDNRSPGAAGTARGVAPEHWRFEVQKQDLTSDRHADARRYYELCEQARQLGVPTSLDDPRSPRTVAGLRAAVAKARP